MLPRRGGTFSFPRLMGPPRLSWAAMLSTQCVSKKRTKVPARAQLSTPYGHRLPAGVPLKLVLGTALINTSSATLWLPVLCRLRAAPSACRLGWWGGWREDKPSGAHLEGPEAQLWWQMGFMAISSLRHAQAACEGNANVAHLPAGRPGLQSPFKAAWLGYNVNLALI